MRLVSLIFSLAILQATAGNLEAQRVSLQKKNATLLEVLQSIRKQTGYLFVCDAETIKSARRVNLNLKQAQLSEVLEAAFRDQPVTYTIHDKTIIVRKVKPQRDSEPSTTGAKTSARQGTDFESGLKNSEMLGQSLLERTKAYLLRDIQVRGRVVDEAGDVLPGVSILIKGTQRGTSTDGAGNFELEVPGKESVLIFSFVGFSSKEVVVGNQSELQIQLVSDKKVLEEVVVVGYGVQKKQDLTGAVASVKGEEVAGRRSVQVAQALQGAMAGVTVTRGGNAPGSGATIRIRGVTTIGNSDPLIIVDGVPVNSLNDINPNDVEEISVLKDAASASIYGSRAAAGVVLITTKRAKEGHLSLDYNVSVGMEKATRLPGYVDAVRYMEMTNELRWNDNGNNSDRFPIYPEETVKNYHSLNQQNPDQYPITDWVGLILTENAPRQSHLLNISGGSGPLKTKASIGYDKIGALYEGRTFDRITTRLNNDIKINNYLSAQIDLNYLRSNSRQPSIDPIFYTLISAPVYAATWSDGRLGAGKTGNNIYASLKEGGFNNEVRQNLGGRILLDFKPIKDLVLTGVFAPNLVMGSKKLFRKRVPYYTATDPDVLEGVVEFNLSTMLQEGRQEFQQYTTQFLANYNKEIGLHRVSALAGYENFYARWDTISASRNFYTLTSFPYLNTGPLEFRDNSGQARENAYRSVFARIAYNYDDKYYLQANVRKDGSSRFHRDHRWGVFPSVSAGWVISREGFLGDTGALSFLKLRASWGNLGNERISNYYPYQSAINFESALLRKGGVVSSEPTAAQADYAISDISWEKTESYDLGVDANFFSNRLQVTADYFVKNTKDMLLSIEIPSFLGFSNPQQNAGRMRSKGWEFQAGWQDQVGALKYGVSFNLSDIRSKLGNLGGTQFLGDKIKREGSEFNEWYGYRTAGLFQTEQEVADSPKINANVRPGDVKYLDVSGPEGKPDGKITPDYDRVFLGGSLPRMMYGGNIRLGYKGISLSLAFQGVAKQNSRINPIMVTPLHTNWGSIPSMIDGNYWSVNNTAEQNLAARYPRLSRVQETSNLAMSDYWLFSGAYFRIKNLTVGYDIPTSFTEKIKIKGINAFVSVSDFLTLTKYPKGWDPETASEGTTIGYPITTQYLAGIAVKF
ncbi:TonB-dependent receptor [Ravibacter arvi]|uniref:TonB-dependent receptor n=1 Tax=Ravibacter arvi TaxID=2051041 RepID=A0ABP8M4I3_9BACT